jgi:hypothetical protein
LDFAFQGTVETAFAVLTSGVEAHPKTDNQFMPIATIRHLSVCAECRCPKLLDDMLHFYVPGSREAAALAREFRFTQRNRNRI